MDSGQLQMFAVCLPKQYTGGKECTDWMEEFRLETLLLAAI